MRETVSELEKAVQRPRQYWFEDGLTEMATGVVLGAVGLLFAAEARAPAGSPLASVSALGLPALVLLAAVVGRRLVTTLKERITYPRSGYVRFRPAPRHRPWLAAGIAVALGAMVLMVFRGAPLSLRWIPLLDGVVIGAFLAFLGYRMGVGRFHLLAVISLAAGGFAGARFTDETAGTAAYFAAMGLALAISGAIALRRYLAKT